jgi:hypothetical protein
LGIKNWQKMRLYANTGAQINWESKIGGVMFVKKNTMSNKTMTILTLLLCLTSKSLQAQQLKLRTQLFMNNVTPKILINENGASSKEADGRLRGFEIGLYSKWDEYNNFGVSYFRSQTALGAKAIPIRYNTKNYVLETVNANYVTNGFLFNYKLDLQINDAKKNPDFKLKFVPTLDLGLAFNSDFQYNSTYYDESKVKYANSNTGILLWDIFFDLTSSPTKPYETTSGKGKTSVQGISQVGAGFELETKPIQFFCGYKYGLNKSFIDHWEASNSPLSELRMKSSNSNWYFGIGISLVHQPKKITAVE